MPKIMTVDPAEARGIRKLLFWRAKRNYGMVPGIFRILAVNLRVGRPAGTLYEYLHLRARSPMSRLQREMLATVVNGKVGGAP